MPQPDLDLRAILLSSTVALGLTTVGLATGSGPALALAGQTLGGVGGNLLSDLLSKTLGKARDSWHTSSGALNHDIAQALSASFNSAVKELVRVWCNNTTEDAIVAYYGLHTLSPTHSPDAQHQQQAKSLHTYLAALQVNNRKAALCQKLHDMEKAAKSLVKPERFTTLQDTTVLKFVQGSIPQMRFTRTLQGYFGTDDAILIGLIDQHFVDDWITRFIELLKSDDEHGTAAWRAFLMLFQQSLQQAMDEVKQTTTATHDAVAQLEAFVQTWTAEHDTRIEQTLRQALQPIEAKLDMMGAVLQHIHDAIYRIENKVDQLLAYARQQPDGVSRSAHLDARSKVAATLVIGMPTVDTLVHTLLQALGDTTYTDADVLDVLANPPSADVLEDLVETIRESNPDTVHMQALDTELAHIPGCAQPIARAHVATFLRMVRTVSRAMPATNAIDWPWLYGRVAPRGLVWAPHAPPHRHGIDALTYNMRMLAKTPIQEQHGKHTHALVEFARLLCVEYATHPAVQAVQADLKAWIATIVHELNLSLPEQAPTSQNKHTDEHKGEQKDKHNSPASSAINAYLLVMIRSKQTITDRTDLHTALFRMDAWLIPDDSVQGDSAFTPLNKETRECTLATIPDEFQTVLLAGMELLPEQHSANLNLTVEFFLPAQLLLYSVDHWDIGIFTSVPVGIQHPVVVRPLERVIPSKYREYLARILKEKWHTFQQCQNMQPDHTYVAWLHTMQECHPPPSLAARLKHKDVVSVAQTFVATPSVHVLQVLIETGLPVALCTRNDKVGAEQVRQAFELLLAACTFCALPATIREQRRQAVAADDEEHPGHHLTLMWDDPTRVPPSIAYMEIV